MFTRKEYQNTIKMQPGFARGFAMGLGMLLLVLGGALGFHATMRNDSAAPAAATARASTESPATLSRSFEEVAKGVEPAVVNINTEQIIHNAATQIPDPFRDFFGDNSPFGSFFNNAPRDLKQRSLGSGFLIDPNGYILTNNHVVQNASKIRVKLSDGRMMDAKVVGTDPQTDLAVLKISASTLPTLKLANSDQVQVGDWVLAFGSPFGLTQTMTAGIISAKGRVIGAGPYDNFLQTDAAINPGNSGGPLVNLDGQVVGINTMIASESGGFQGIGFAIPSSMAEPVYTQLVKNGKVTRGWLGVHIQSMTSELAKSFNLEPDKGVLVAQVDANSPASRAGLKSGDVILEYNGRQVHSAQDLSLAVAETKVGAPAKVQVLRDGRPLSLEVRVGERPQDVAENLRSPQDTEHGKLGITVENITPEAASELQLSSSKGVLVTEVKPGSPADDGGVQTGDVIHEINHMPVNNASDLLAVIRNLKSGSNVLLKVERQGQTMFLAFQLS
jgi:serine protease Do